MPQRSRTTISLSAGLAALVLGLSACSGSTPGADTGTTAGGEDTLRLAFLGGISTPDPDSAYDGYELNLVNSAYEGLLDYRPGQAEPELVGRLATEWTASDDNTEFTFTLREGVTFHDGTPFTADAVKASFDRRLAVDAGPAYMVKGVESVTSSGENEVTVRLSSPNASFLDLLASPFGPKMISPAALKEHPWTGEEDNWFATNDAGTGPYSYSAFEPGVSYGLKEYADYWGEEPGYANVDFAVASNLSTVQLQLEKGEVDGLIGYTDSASYASLESKENLTGYTFPSMQTPTLFVNPKSPELSDDATRKAFMAGIDFPSLAQKALGDTGAPTTQVFPENLIPAELNQQKIQPVPGALPDLAEGKLSGGTISCGYPESSASGQSLCDNLTAGLNEAGVKAESTGYASGTFFPALEKAPTGRTSPSSPASPTLPTPTPGAPSSTPPTAVWTSSGPRCPGLRSCWPRLRRPTTRNSTVRSRRRSASRPTGTRPPRAWHGGVPVGHRRCREVVQPGDHRLPAAAAPDPAGS